MEVVVYVVIWLALCAVVGFYAEGKGRSGVGIFFLSFFLSPLVGLIAAVSMRADENKIAVAQGKKQCPQCAEYVQPEAKICRFCQHRFPEVPEVEQLRALGIEPGSACPKCGSVNTFRRTDREKSTRWWKDATVLRRHCRKCGETWDGAESSPVETTRWGLLVSLGLLTFITVLVIYTLAQQHTG